MANAHERRRSAGLSYTLPPRRGPNRADYTQPAGRPHRWTKPRALVVPPRAERPRHNRPAGNRGRWKRGRPIILFVRDEVVCAQRPGAISHQNDDERPTQRHRTHCGDAARHQDVIGAAQNAMYLTSYGRPRNPAVNAMANGTASSSSRYTRFSRAFPSSPLCCRTTSGRSAKAAGRQNNTPPTMNVHQGAEDRSPLDCPLLNAFSDGRAVYQCP